jgi:polysaccharide deacetylase 2 family uncharacterized protein YibQ
VASPQTARRKRKTPLTLEDGVHAALIGAAILFAVSLIAFAVFVVAPSLSSAGFAPLPVTEPDRAAPPVAAPRQGLREAAPPPGTENGGMVTIAPPTVARPPVAAPHEGPQSDAAPSEGTENRSVVTGTPPSPLLAAPLPATPTVEMPAMATPPRDREQPVPGGRKTLAIVIDDAGNNLAELEPFLQFPGPLTIAVLPGLRWSVEAARRIRAAGKEVILHQPMEALGGEEPGPGAIFAHMESAEIRRIINKNLDEIGPAAGLNNHQGSRVTEDAAAMETVLAVCRERGIYFLDSRTTAGTAAPAAARRLAMEIGERDIFLDNVQDRAVMADFLREGALRAERRGSAVMIGHTWSPALAGLLAESYAELRKQGYVFATVSALLAEKGAR